jgi:site-specific recombinase XerD
LEIAMQNDTARTPAPDTTLADIAASGFLARYRGETVTLYSGDLRIFYAWCRRQDIDPLQVKRYHLEEFRRHLEDDRGNSPRSVRRRLQTLRTFYRLAVADEYIDRDPTLMLRLPENRALKEPLWLDRFQVGALLRAAEAESPAHHALIALMVMLGLRVSEACNVQIEDFAADKLGYRVLRLIGKGGKPAAMPVPVPLLRILETARGDRTSGPLILRRDGRAQDRNGAYAWVKILARKAGLPEDTHPHSLRHAAVTAVIDSGADLREAQEFARHADPGMTVHYYRRAGNLDRHAAHVAARVFASAV